MGVCVQQAGLEQLDEVAVEQRAAQLPHIRSVALAQLLACPMPQTPSLSSTHLHVQCLSNSLLASLNFPHPAT